MIASLSVFPAEVSAAPKKDKTTGSIAPAKETIPRMFPSKEACLADLNTRKLADLKTYGEKRIRIRDRTLDSYPKSIEKAYGSKFDKAQNTAEIRIKEAKRAQISATGGTNIDDNLKTDPNKQSLLREVNATKKLLAVKSDQLSKAKTSSEAANVICSVVFDLKVYAYLDKKIKTQVLIEKTNLLVKSNEARKKATLSVYDKNKSNKKFAKKVEKYKAELDNMPKAEQQTAALNNLRTQIKEINIETLNNDIEGGKAKLDSLLAQAKEVNTTAKQQGQTINKLYKEITKAAKQKQPPKQKPKKDKPQENTGGARYEAPGVLR